MPQALRTESVLVVVSSGLTCYRSDDFKEGTPAGTKPTKVEKESQKHRADIPPGPCEACGTPLKGEWAARGTCAECAAGNRLVARPPSPVVPGKSKGVATVLALLLGGVGAHKFYLDRPGMGFLYLFFCWSLIPAIVALVEGIGYAVTDEESFSRKYP